MTVHKSQGSEFTHTVLVLPDQYNRVLTRELVDTGLTRARERFTLVAPNPEVFTRAVEQRTQCSSALAERLAEHDQNPRSKTKIEETGNEQESSC